jgi:PAS domain S-box-containing protein
MPRPPGTAAQIDQKELLRRLDRLCLLAGEIAALRDEDETLRSIVEAAVEVTGVPAAHLALVDREQRALYGVISSGKHPPDAQRLCFELRRSLAASQALRTRRPVLIPDASRDRRVHPEARDLLSIGGIAYVPLLGGGRSFGLLILTTREPHRWLPACVRLAVYTANIASVALQTAHLLTSLMQTDARLRNLLEDVGAIPYTCEVDFPYHTYYVGPEAEAILGYSPRAWVEDPDLFYKLVHPDDLHGVIEATEAAKIGRGFVRSEYRLLDRDGNTHWFRDEAVLLRDPSGRPQAWHGVLVDVTALRERGARRPGANPHGRPLSPVPPQRTD